MSSDYCDLCDLPLSMCVHGRPAGKEADPIVTGPTITATQTTPCDECGGRISPGDSITHTDVGWIHTEHVRVQVEDAQPPTDSASQFEGFSL